MSLIYGIMRILNLAHGSLYMLGAYVAYTVIVLIFGVSWWSFLLAYLAAMGVVGLAGLFLEEVPLKPLYDKPEELQLLLTFGIMLMFDDIVKFVWGAEYKGFPKLVGGSIPLGEHRVPVYSFIIIASAFIIAGILWLFFNRTTLGKQVRATAYNREVAAAIGINVNTVFIVAFVIGAALSGLAGAMAGPIYNASPGMGTEAIVMSFAVIVIGGMGSISGALIGSIIVGLSRTIMVIVYPFLEVALIYVVMAAILLIKPTGIFGKEEVERR